MLFVIGLFWLSSYGKVYTFGYGFWYGSMVVIANVGVFCLFEYWYYCFGVVVMNIECECLYSSRGAGEERECK